MKILYFSFFLFFVFFINGCSSSGYAITYNTFPPSANIICNGSNEGYSPITVYYDFENNQTFLTQECIAVWTSGASALFPTNWEEVVKQYPNGVQFTLPRPSPEEYPGFEKDMQFAFEVERFKMEQKNIRDYNFQQSMENLGSSFDDFNQLNDQLILQQQNQSYQMLQNMQQ